MLSTTSLNLYELDALPTTVRNRITVDGNGCWIVSGYGVGNYAKASLNGKRGLAHRLVYEFFVAPIPEGLQIDHLCRTPRCANPAHLETVTQRVNLLRGEGVGAINARLTHCVNGHSLTPDNLYPDYGGGTRRRCATCARERTREYARVRREAYEQLRRAA